jgi:hypothetical protein
MASNRSTAASTASLNPLSLKNDPGIKHRAASTRRNASNKSASGGFGAFQNSASLPWWVSPEIS